MVFRHTSRARGLSRLSLCSGTVQTTIVLGDYPDHHRARGLSRHYRARGLFLTTIVLGNCSDHCSETALLSYM